MKGDNHQIKYKNTVSFFVGSFVKVQNPSFSVGKV